MFHILIALVPNGNSLDNSFFAVVSVLPAAQILANAA